MSKEVIEPTNAAPPAANGTGPGTALTRELVTTLPGPVPRRSPSRGVSIVGLTITGLIIVLIAGLIWAQQFVPKTPAVTTHPQSVSQANQAPAVSVPSHQTYNAQPPVAPTGNSVNIKLVAKEALISIAPGIAYQAWTFNGTVPGPILRVRQGQTVNFTLVNDSSMAHSIDFHAASTPWNVNYQPIAPGKSFSFSWRANFPGVFMYHCGTPPVIEHIANGMYGAIIVDPAQGWVPAQEYVLVQGEFYTHQNPDGTYTGDYTRMLAGVPDYVVFNGYADQYKAAPLTVKLGQRLRLFIMNAGPSQFSAFHTIGAMFDDVYVDGNPANHMVGNQTITVPPGGGAVVELMIPQVGLYPFVTHSFADASKGALGVIKVIA